MAVWQIVLEYVKVIGPGALAGVLVGVFATRGQKNREALQAIKAANYVEVKAAYRELSKVILDIRNAAQDVVTVAHLLDGVDRGDFDESGREIIVKRLQERYGKFEGAMLQLDGRIADTMVHRSETDFHIIAFQLRDQVRNLNIALMGISYAEWHSDYDIQGSRDSLTRLEELDGLLKITWDKWKIEAENEAAGNKPLSEKQLEKLLTTRRM